MIVSAALLFWSLVYAGASATAIARARVRRPHAAPEQGHGHLENLLLIRPCAGNETCLEQALRSSIGAARIVFCVANENDSAFPTVLSVASEVSASVYITGARGMNQKAQQIARVLSLEPSKEVVVICDSDVVLRSGDLTNLIAPLDHGAVAAWAAPAEVLPSVTFGDRISSAILSSSLHSFPLLAGIDSDGMVGKLVAIRREALEKSGGFVALAAFLGEDMELGRRLRQQGRVTFSRDVLAHSHASQRSVRDTLDRFTRWVQVIRAQRPALLLTYPLILAAWPLIAMFAIASFVTAPSDASVALSALAVATLARALVAVTGRRIVGRSEATALGDMMVSDLALLIAFIRAACSRTVMWRGNRLLLGKGGVLQ